MNGSRPLCLMIVVATALSASARGADGPAAKVMTENDIVYTKAGGTELKLDLARPAEGDGPFPACS